MTSKTIKNYKILHKNIETILKTFKKQIKKEIIIKIISKNREPHIITTHKTNDAFISNLDRYDNFPFTSTNGTELGFISILKEKAQSLSEIENSLLSDFSTIIANTIENHYEIERLQDVFTDFLHKTVHDLKNPLTSISLTSELLKRKADDAQTVIKFSDRLEKASQRVFSSLDELKSTFPLENDSFKLHIEEIDVREFLSEIKNNLNNSFTLENNEDIKIYADYKRLKDAVTTLVKQDTISIKSHTKNNEVVIEIISDAIAEDNSITAKILIALHKGKLETKANAYFIYLPLGTP